LFLRVSVQVTVADFGGPALPAVANIVIATGVSHCPYGVALHRLRPIWPRRNGGALTCPTFA